MVYIAKSNKEIMMDSVLSLQMLGTDLIGSPCGNSSVSCNSANSCLSFPSAEGALAAARPGPTGKDLRQRSPLVRCVNIAPRGTPYLSN